MRQAKLAAMALVLSVPLVVAGCGGSSEGEDGMPGRDELMGYIRAEVTDSGLPAETVDCIVNAMDGLTDEELFSILEDTPSVELDQKVTELTSVCA
jgi:hypothetical protein